jgi:hypothetical protein
MSDLHKQKQRDHLAETDRHIASAERRIVEQERRLTELMADGHKTTEAQRLLTVMQESLEQYKIHRQAIVDELNK